MKGGARVESAQRVSAMMCELVGCRVLCAGARPISTIVCCAQKIWAQMTSRSSWRNLSRAVVQSQDKSGCPKFNGCGVFSVNGAFSRATV